MSRFRHAIRAFVVSIAVAVAVAGAGAQCALAAPASAPQVNPQARVLSFDVQVWPGGSPGQLLVLVGATIAEDQALPATVSLPLPEGATLVWSGEIVGESASSDIESSATVSVGPTGRIVTLVATTSREVQIEYVAGPLAVDGQDVSMRMQWVQSVPSSMTAIAIRVPAQAQDVEISPPPVGQPESNEVGERLYRTAPAELEVGETIPIEVTYRLGTATEPSGPTTGVLIGLGVVVALIAVVLFVRLQRSRPA